MPDSNHLSCRRCGGLVSADDPGGLCPSCLESENGLEKGEAAAVRSEPLPPSHRDRGRASFGALGSILRAAFGQSPARRAKREAEAEAHCNRASSLFDDTQWDEAIDEYRKAIRLNPGLAEAHSKLGSALLKQFAPSDAVVAFREAFRLNPDDQEALKNIQLAVILQNKPGELIAEWRRAIRINPNSAFARSALGRALRDQGKLNEAIVEFRALTRINPDSAFAHHDLGCALRDQGELEEAITELRAATRLAPDFADAHYHLGIALDGQGNMRDAEVAFRKALRLEPDEGIHHNGLALCLAALPGRPGSDYEEALLHARKAVEQKPESGNRYATVSLAEYRLGHWTESLAACEQAMTLQGGCDALTGFLFALAGGHAGERETAVRAFETAVEWMKERNSDYPTLCQLWTEAADLLGRRPTAPARKPGKQ